MGCLRLSSRAWFVARPWLLTVLICSGALGQEQPQQQRSIGNTSQGSGRTDIFPKPVLEKQGEVEQGWGLPATMPALSFKIRKTPQGSRRRILLFAWGKGRPEKALEAIRTELLKERRFEIVLGSEALEYLKGSEETQRALRDVTTLTEAGRAAEISLQWSLAETMYRRALEALEETLVRLYDPESVARIYLALGAVAVHQGDTSRAHESFIRALMLFPPIKPDRSYNPQVRAAFEEVRTRVQKENALKKSAQEQAPTFIGPPPTLVEAARLCALTASDLLLLITEEEAHEGPTLRASLFSAERRGFIAVETRVLTQEDGAIADIVSLAHRIRDIIRGHFPLSKPPASFPSSSSSQPATVPTPPPPPPPWYKRWWIWACVGGTVALSVFVPVVLLRRDTITLVVPY